MIDPSNPSLAVVAAINDDRVLEQNLLRSPMLAGGAVPLIIERGHDSAGKAYNCGAARTQADLVIFAHQDVYFPAGWDSRMLRAVSALDDSGAEWGVLGVWGVGIGNNYHGRVWCTGSNQEFSGPVREVVPVASIDEIVIVVKRSAALTFDQHLPGFHFYATDLALQARQRGLSTYVFDGPVVHNSRTVPQLGAAYVEAYRYMQRKWRSHLPLPTCVIPLTRTGWPLHKYRALVAMRLLLNRVNLHPRHDAPAAVSRKLGYEA
jgi:hypothetical protein